MCQYDGDVEVITVREFRRRSVAGLVLGLCAVVLFGYAGPSASADGSPPAVGAAGIWSASLEGVHGVAPDATVRQIARVSVSGAGIRVRFGNPFGASPVVIKEAWAGRPVVSRTFAINYALGGLNVRGYRLVNIAIHVINGLLLFAIAARTLRVRDVANADSVAFAIALLWMKLFPSLRKVERLE